MNRPDDLDRAEARVAAARAQLDATVERIQVRLDPTTLKRLAVDTVADGSQRALAASTIAARRNPAVLAGAAVLVVALLARRRIAAAFSRTPKPAAEPLLLEQPARLERVRIQKPDPARRIPTS